MKRPQMLNRRNKGALGETFVIVVLLLLCLLLAELRFTTDFFVVGVSGPSMENTVFDGDYLYADATRTPAHGDVVIVDVTDNPFFTRPAERDELLARGERKYIIKRAVAFAGEAIKCEGGTLFVRYRGEKEFTAVDEPYVAFETYDFGAVEVGEGEVFCLGDHRTESSDSRVAGCLKLSDVVGVVPGWAFGLKSVITAWENFRVSCRQAFGGIFGT